MYRENGHPLSFALMNCPACDHDDIRILETRDDRRRRECRRCLNRWTTYEVRAEDLERLQRLEYAVKQVLEPAA